MAVGKLAFLECDFRHRICFLGGGDPMFSDRTAVDGSVRSRLRSTPNSLSPFENPDNPELSNSHQVL
jgi:hypothetical protein